MFIILIYNFFNLRNQRNLCENLKMKYLDFEDNADGCFYV